MSLSIKRAKELLAGFRHQRVAVVGDLMLDRYIEGSVDRISPEAPVPVVRVRSERSVPGGASNVAVNLRAMGGGASVCGLAGRDAAGRDLIGMLRAARVGTAGVTRPAGLRTTVKTRILAERQQVVRVDHEDAPELAGAALKDACRSVAAEVARSTGVIIEDYGKGFVCQPVIDAVLAAARRAGIPSGLDPKDNHELDVRGITVATPNRREAFHGAQRKDPGAGPDPLADAALLGAARVLLRRWAPRHLLVTLGPQGMLLAAPGAKPRHIPTRAIAVYDVSGAGDTVIAVCVLSLAAGATDEEAAEIANYAAGVVVAKLGTATCTPAELIAHMRECDAEEG